MPPNDPPLSVSDMARLGQVWEEHRPRLLAMLTRRIDPGLAVRIDPEDVLSEAFLDAARKWEQFDARSGLLVYPWLYRIARDRLIEIWRRETRAPRDLRRDLPWPEQSSLALGLSLVAPGTGPSELAARGELKQLMGQALGLLKDSYREILWMRHYEQLGFAEIGDVLGITENNATVRYVRALKRLKECWQAIKGDEL